MYLLYPHPFPEGEDTKDTSKTKLLASVPLPHPTSKKKSLLGKDTGFQILLPLWRPDPVGMPMLSRSQQAIALLDKKSAGYSPTLPVTPVVIAAGRSRGRGLSADSITFILLTVELRGKLTVACTLYLLHKWGKVKFHPEGYMFQEKIKSAFPPASEEYCSNWHISNIRITCAPPAGIEGCKPCFKH